MTLVELFNIGMMRKYPDPLKDKYGTVLNIGAGNKPIEGAIPLDWPAWNAEIDVIPYESNSIAMIHCYHFLEHIKNVPFVLSEMRRVLIPGGHINIVVPYYNSSMQAQDLDHKSCFTENTWKVLFDSAYYQKGKVIPMEIHTNFIMGDQEKNLCLVTQLRKPTH